VVATWAVIFLGIIAQEMHNFQLPKQSQREKASDTIRTKDWDDGSQVAAANRTATRGQGFI
jgi:hypothetical protein